MRLRGSGKVFNVFTGGTGTIPNGSLYLFYLNSNTVRQSHYTNDFDKNIPAFSSVISTIHSFVFSKNDGKAIYTNGGTKTTNTSQKTPLISYAGSSIGYGTVTGGVYYLGNIAEMIFYSRALSDKERQDVENYLSKKWAIKLS